jgi:hypothetical protein
MSINCSLFIMTKKQKNPNKPKAMTAREKSMARQLANEHGRMPKLKEIKRRPKPEETYD